MKSKPVSALDQLLADMGNADITPQQDDEVTSPQLAERLGISICAASDRLLTLKRAGKYSRRRLGKVYLYRKIQ